MSGHPLIERAQPMLRQKLMFITDVGMLAMNSFKIIFLGALSLCGLSACNDTAVDVTVNEDTPKIFLREKPKYGQYAFPEALFIAELTIINECVQLIQNDDNSNAYTPSWPDYTRLMKTKDGYYIKIKNKRLDFGKTYHFGGGVYDVMPGTPMHKACESKRLWFVGEVAK